ncbi:hypothetical protein L596_028042 [Steinernema carpocapsae]|uniref:Uncharacterized protein n=1 Tax=Steinernema carpocapsae TaxID=34508 RepID=A0A4U5LX98_STECR|nr:hypothetical protein L596_028042 [Steinernema carpocapsae]
MFMLMRLLPSSAVRRSPPTVIRCEVKFIGVPIPRYERVPDWLSYMLLFTSKSFLIAFLFSCSPRLVLTINSGE